MSDKKLTPQEMLEQIKAETLRAQQVLPGCGEYTEWLIARVEQLERALVESLEVSAYYAKYPGGAKTEMARRRMALPQLLRKALEGSDDVG